MVGSLVTGPSPLRDTSKSAMRQSVPVRKCVCDDQTSEAGVRYASVVGEMRLYVAAGTGTGDRALVSRIGSELGVLR